MHQHLDHPSFFVKDALADRTPKRGELVSRSTHDLCDAMSHMGFDNERR
jgi:hypothetical protein